MRSLASYRLVALTIAAGITGTACSRPNPDYPSRDASNAASPSGAPFSIIDPPLPDGFTGTVYEASITITGEVGGDLRWSITAGDLPPGISLKDSLGSRATLGGTPTATGTWSFTVAAENDSGARTTRVLRIVVWSLRIDGELPSAVEGQTYDSKLTILGGAGLGLHWSVGGGTLPPGLHLLAKDRDAEITGTAAAGFFSFSLIVTDANGGRVERSFTLLVRSSLSLDDVTLSPAVEGRPYAAAVRVHGGTGSGYHWQASGTLPAGIAVTQIDSESVALQGTPTAPGTYPFTLTVTDATGGSATRDVLLDVLPRLQIVTTHLPDGLLATAYSTTIAASGGSGTGYAWSVDSGLLPPGLTLVGSGSTATLRGTPATTGSFDFALAAALATGERAVRNFHVVIGNNPPRILTSSIPAGTWGATYQASIDGQSVVGGAIAWRVTGGSLPPGLSLAASTQPSVAIAGTPKQCGVFTFTLAMSDAGGTATAPLSITIGATTDLEILSRVFTPARAGREYSARLATRRAQGQVQWTIDDGQLPPGLSLTTDSTAGGLLSGTPTKTGWYSFSARATDSAGRTASRRFAILVAPARWWAAMAHTTTLDGPWSVTLRDVSIGTPGAPTDLITNLAPGGGASCVYNIRFSPDPDWLTFTAGDLDRQTLYMADLRANPKVHTLSYGQVRGDRTLPLTWSPDGTSFAFAAEPIRGSFQFSHWVGSASSGSVDDRLVTPAPCQYERIWSPDATRLAVASADGATIYVYADGRTRTIPLPAAMRVRKLVSWTPDSTHLIFFGADTNAPTEWLYALGLDGGDEHPFSLTPDDVTLSGGIIHVSPDGGSIAFPGQVAGANNIAYVLDLRSPQLAFAQPVISGNDGAWVPISWSPDSQYLLVTSDGVGDAVIDRDQVGAIPPRPLPESGLGAPTSYRRWSLDGAYVTVPSHSGLYAVPTTGSGAPDQLLAPPLQDADYDWLSAERRVLIYSSGGGLFALDLTTTPRKAAALDGSGAGAYFAVAHQREAVFYYRFGSSSQGTTSKLWMVDMSQPSAAAPVEVLDFGTGLLHYAISDDGQFVGTD